MMKVLTAYISRLFAMALLAVLVLVTGCSDTDFAGLSSKGGAEVEVMFYPELDETQTRALADGTKIDQLVVVAVEAGNAPVITKMDWAEVSLGVKVTLFQGRTYDLLFWAQHKDNGVYTVGETVTADYTQVGSGFAGMEMLDAFCAVRKGVAVGTKPIDGGTITLGRPFAQLNLADLHNPAEEGKNYAATLHVSGLATTFNPFAENAEDFTSGAADATFSYSDYDTQTAEDRLTIGTDTYYYIASAYLFAPATVQVTYSFMEDGKEMTGSTQPSTVALAPKKRFNLYGDIILSEDTFDGTLQMRTPLPESYDAVTASYLVDECDDLVWMSEAANLAQLTQGNSFTLTTDLNFSADKGIAINSVNLPVGAIVNGDDKTIRNARVHGGGLFGDAEGITLSNLTVESLSAEGTPATHVGALVNTLKGSATFQNVIVKNATVTTSSGAAGGMVGYIVRKSKDSRDEALEVKFENCQVAATNSIEGTMGEGLFVGLLRGYDNGEKLSFSGCSISDEVQTKAAAANLDSYYREANKAAFVDGSFTPYDAWLGNEECYRAIVSFDGKRLVVKWDGTTKITPLVENGNKSIYSAFDLASQQNISAGNLKFMVSVDMASLNFEPLTYISALYGNDKTIYNLKIDTQWDANAASGGAFARRCEGGTFENITFKNADVRVTHSSSDGDAYAAIVCATLEGSPVAMNNVKIEGGSLYGVNKMGGIAGYIVSDLNCTDCVVDGLAIQNYDSGGKDSFGFKANGEVGGMFGFVAANATISGCYVKNTTLNCVGVNNGRVLFAFKYAGRHINEFIGDIRTTSGQTIKITYTDSDFTGNQYKNRKDQYSGCNKIGHCYYTNISVPVIGIGITDTKGSVTVNGKSITVAKNY